MVTQLSMQGVSGVDHHRKVNPIMNVQDACSDGYLVCIVMNRYGDELVCQVVIHLVTKTSSFRESVPSLIHLYVVPLAHSRQ